MNKRSPVREQEAGLFFPIIDRNACEGKGPCVQVCLHNVLVMGILPLVDRGQLTRVGKVKGFVHGWRQAFIVDKDACTACGLCVQSCPEKAIKLGRHTDISS